MAGQQTRSGKSDGENEAILCSLFDGQLSVTTAAERLASICLDSQSIERGLNTLWASIMRDAREQPEYQETLVDLLVALSELPSPQDDEGKSLTVYDMKVWDQLPMLGWLFNGQWNGLNVPTEGSERQTVITGFINVNNFAARLLKTGREPFRGFDLFALWTMRSALETPLDENSTAAFVQAAAAWISILGNEMSSWNKDFQHGSNRGDPGRAGPLWSGGEVHGFCRERWEFWEARFGDLSTSQELTPELQRVAKDAQKAMEDAEE